VENIFESIAEATKPDSSDFLYVYPELTEKGKEVTQNIIDKFSKQLIEIFNDTIYSFTQNISEEITDDDSWISIRNKTRDALCGYPVSGSLSATNWVQIRKKILEENRDQIINDIISDKEDEIKRLNDTIIYLREHNRY